MSESDETITQAQREMLIGRHKGGSRAADDIRWLLDAIAAAEKRVEEAEREAERLRHGTTIEGDFTCPHELRASLIQPLADAARVYVSELRAIGDMNGAGEKLKAVACKLFDEGVL